MDFNNFKFFGTLEFSPVRVQILEANKMFSQKKRSALNENVSLEQRYIDA